VWGSEHVTDTGYLRPYVSQLRKKLEPDPEAPRFLITEPGTGYRFPPPRMTSAARVVHRCVERPWTRGTGRPSRGGRATGHAAEEGSENDGFRGT
jgi:hypothetical protein